MSETPAVTRASLGETFPIIAPVPMTLLPARVWTAEQWERIKRGYRARSMDEKWDVFAESQVAFLHRSWTGRGVNTHDDVGGAWQQAGMRHLFGFAGPGEGPFR
jgi:hypothetical protein